MKTTRKFLIAIDIGNSRISYAAYLGGRLHGVWYSYNDAIPNIGYLIVKSGVYNRDIRCIISSVVPKNTLKVTKSLYRILPKRSVYIVGKDLFPKIKMKYQRKQLGSDRLVNIYGAIRRYKLPLLVVDFGTAITFDYVGRSGVFEGGLIVPGIETSLWALEERAALLPKLGSIKDVHTLAAHDTVSAMRSGLLNGFGALADGLIDRFKRRYGPRLKVLATGGFAKKIARYTRNLDYIDPLHTIRSLALIYRNEIEEIEEKNR